MYYNRNIYKGVKHSNTMMEIKMYGKEGCVACESIKKRFSILGINYSYVDIIEDNIALGELSSKWIVALPAVKIIDDDGTELFFNSVMFDNEEKLFEIIKGE